MDNRNTKKLVKYEKSYEYFSENTIRLHENICTLLSIVSENITEVCIEKSTTESTAFYKIEGHNYVRIYKFLSGVAATQLLFKDLHENEYVAPK